MKPFLPYFALLSALFCSVISAPALSAAQTGWQVGVSVEAYTWEETITGIAFKPKETGNRMALNFGWEPPKKDGRPYFAYAGRLYGGTVDYNTVTVFPGGFTSPSPTSTDYVGMMNEIRGILPTEIVSVVSGLGYDYWSRSLADTVTAVGVPSTGYNEHYGILFMRLGLSANVFDRVEISGGVKRTIKNDETASNASITLHPGASTSSYWEVSYKVGSNFNLAAYYDSYRFGESRKTGVRGWYQPASRMDAVGIKGAWLF